ncbi:MAG: hypothetical protein AB1775_14940 [Bacteroidota bacterium]
MTNHEENKLNMFNSVLAVLKEHETAVAEIPAMAETVSQFQTEVDGIVETDAQYKKATSGKTAEKNVAVEEVIVSLLPVRSALYALALKTKDEELKAVTSSTEGYLKKLRDVELIQKAETILQTAQQKINDLTPYKITAEKLTALKSNIDELKASSGKKESGFSNKSALRKSLTEKFERADEILNEHLDTMMELVRQDDPQFYNQYFSARVIKDLGAGRKTTEPQPVPEPSK